jgi:hypothetical protein
MLTLALLFLNIAETKTMVEYEIARRQQSYTEALESAKQRHLPIVVWVNMGDAYEPYSKISRPAVHVFVNTFPGVNRGVVVDTTDVRRYNIHPDSDIAANINLLLERKTNVSR